MRVLALTPPGRFPSVALDTGLWWDRVAAGGRHELLRFSANYAWWRVICSERFKKLALEPLSAIDRVKRRAEWRAQSIALAEDAKAASRSLDLIQTPQSFRSASDYLRSLSGLAASSGRVQGQHRRRSDSARTALYRQRSAISF